MRLLALGFVLGAAWLQRQEALPGWNALLLAAAPLLAAVAFARLRAPMLFIAAALAGFGWAAWRAEVRMADALPPAWEGRDIDVTGIVEGLPTPGARGTRFTFHVEAVHGAEVRVPSRVALAWYPEAAGASPEVAAGERWRFTVRLKVPRGLANRHGFDYEAWTLERGVRATGYVRAKPPPIRLDARVDGWPWTLHRWRGEIRESMRRHLDREPYAGVLVALAIGDQAAIDAEDWRTFWRAGVGHLMSISGLHVTMLGGLAYALAAFLWVRVPRLALRWPARKAGAIAAVLAAGGYCLLAGYAVPAQRTFVMLVAIAACVLTGRHGSPSRVIAIAALAVVLVDPWAVMAAGFWLSYGAVAAIFLAAAGRIGAPGRWQGAALEQLAATVAMLPLLVALFQEVSAVSPAANAIAIPWVAYIVVPLTLVGAFLDAALPLEAAHAIFSALMTPIGALANAPGAVIEAHAPSPWTLVAALVGCAWVLAPRGVPLRSLGAAWLVPMFAVAPPAPAPGEAWVDVLDVGHGLAVLVRTSSHALVYDAGPSWSAHSDAGERVVVPHLRGEGVRRLDALVVSHRDDDHYGGARSVIDRRAPPTLWSPLDPADALHARVGISRLCEPGHAWHWDGVGFEVLHPPAGPARRENDRSCVLRVAAAGGSMLLTGDLEARGEVVLVARHGARLASDVLVVPHHGSRTSSSPALLDAVRPTHAIASVGHRNRFRHPHPQVVARYDERFIAFHRTDQQGAMRVVLPSVPQDVGRVASLRPPMRYWRPDRRAAHETE